MSATLCSKPQITKVITQSHTPKTPAILFLWRRYASTARHITIPQRQARADTLQIGRSNFLATSATEAVCISGRPSLTSPVTTIIPARFPSHILMRFVFGRMLRTYPILPVNKSKSSRQIRIRPTANNTAPAVLLVQCRLAAQPRPISAPAAIDFLTFIFGFVVWHLAPMRYKIWLNCINYLPFAVTHHHSFACLWVHMRYVN